MKIAIDGKWLYTGNISGKIVVRNLICNLNIKKNNQYFILVKNKEFDLAKKEFGEKYNIIPIFFLFNNAITNIFIIPFYIFKHSLDVAVLQTFGSIFFRSRIAIFVHDLLYKDFPEYFSTKEKIYFFPIIFLLKRARLLLTTSEYVVKSIMKHCKLKKKNIKKIGLGVDHLSKIKSVKPKKIKKKQKYILFVGRLNNRKNILTLINAFNSLKNEYLKLVIVGQKSHKFKNFNNLIKQKN